MIFWTPNKLWRFPRFIVSIFMRIFTNPAVLLLFFFTICPLKSNGQTGNEVYTGLRINLFDFKVLQIRGKTVLLKCRIANTGRQETGHKKNAERTLVTLDTFNLPAILWGHEAALAAAALNQLPKLQPGDISTPIWLDMVAKSPEENPEGTVGCPDLVIDTAYIFRYADDNIALRYEIRNIGAASVEIAGKGLQLGVNVYYISGTKLTRGAIPAGNTAIQIGRETLTGWLKPRQGISGEMMIGLNNRTKFAPNLLLELAPPPSLTECDRTNNTRSLEVKN